MYVDVFRNNNGQHLDIKFFRNSKPFNAPYPNAIQKYTNNHKTISKQYYSQAFYMFFLSYLVVFIVLSFYIY